MVNSTIERQLHEQLHQLPLDQQRQVLDFARGLVASGIRGVPGASLARFAGTIGSDELAIMANAIDEACGRRDSDVE